MPESYSFVLEHWVTYEIVQHAQHLQGLDRDITGNDWGVFADRCEEAGASEDEITHLRDHRGFMLVSARSCSIIWQVLQVGKERGWCN